MAGGEVRRYQATPKELRTQAEDLISTIKDRLGSSYYLESHAKTVASGNGLLLYREVAFKRRGLFGLNNQRLGAQTLLTLITDSRHIREIEEQSQKQEILSTPPIRIDGWMPQDGRSLILQTVEPEDIPVDVRSKLKEAKIAYFATAEGFAYIYQAIPAQDFLADKRRQALKA